MVQNAAARMLTGTKKREHITPVLAQLHWLPVKFKIDLLFVKLLMAQPPLILLKCFPHTPPQGRPGHPQNSSNLSPRTRLKTKGDRAFSVAGPNLWNPLPTHIKSSTTLASFKSNLKTYLFTLAFNNP
jgi:hypothetical protein